MKILSRGMRLKQLLHFKNSCNENFIAPEPLFERFCFQFCLFIGGFANPYIGRLGPGEVISRSKPCRTALIRQGLCPCHGQPLVLGKRLSVVCGKDNVAASRVWVIGHGSSQLLLEVVTWWRSGPGSEHYTPGASTTLPAVAGSEVPPNSPGVSVGQTEDGRAPTASQGSTKLAPGKFVTRSPRFRNYQPI